MSKFNNIAIFSISFIFAVIVSTAVGMLMYKPVENTNVATDTNQTQQSQGVTKAEDLLNDTKVKINELSTLINSSNTTGFQLIPKVSAQEDINDQIIDLVFEIEGNLIEIEDIVNNENSNGMEDLLDLLELELEDIKDQYNLIVENASDNIVILVKPVSESLDDLDDSVDENTLEKVDDSIKVTARITEKINRYERKAERYRNVLVENKISIDDLDITFIEESLFEVAGLVVQARNQLESGEVQAAYLSIEEVGDILDSIEDTIDSYLYEDEELSGEYIRLEALSKLSNAKSKLEKANEELLEESPSQDNVTQATSLLTEAEGIIAEAQSYFDNEQYPESIRTSERAREVIKFATKLIKENSTEKYDEIIENAEELVKELTEKISEAESEGTDSATITSAQDLLNSANTLLDTENYVEAANSARKGLIILSQFEREEKREESRSEQEDEVEDEIEMESEDINDDRDNESSEELKREQELEKERLEAEKELQEQLEKEREEARKEEEKRQEELEKELEKIRNQIENSEIDYDSEDKEEDEDVLGLTKNIYIEVIRKLVEV